MLELYIPFLKTLFGRTTLFPGTGKATSNRIYLEAWITSAVKECTKSLQKFLVIMIQS